MKDATSERTSLVKSLLDTMKEIVKVEQIDHETVRMTEMLVVLRISSKLINLWMRRLEMKRKEICQLAMLMGLEEVKKEVEKEKNIERWTRRCAHHFTKKVKRIGAMR